MAKFYLHLNHELSFNVGVENPQTLLVIERVEWERLRKVSWMKLAWMCCESFLTTHCVGNEIVRRFISKSFCAPRILCNRVDQFNWTPTSQSNRQPLGTERAAKTVYRLIIFGYHHEVIDVFNAVQTSQALTSTISTNRLAFSVSTQSIEQVNCHRDTLISGGYEIVWAIQASFDIPE